MSSEQKRTVTRNFHGHEYALTVSATNDILSVECKENYRGGGIWTSKFTSRFIEEITQRTGNFKTFSVFAKMLLSALNGDSESVTLDLLTADDLERMRYAQQTKTNRNVQLSQASLSGSDRRYLILTYQVEYDKVHYPLALTQLSPATAPPEPIPSVPANCHCGAAMLHADLQRQLVDSLAREASNRQEFQRLVADFEAERDRLSRHSPRVSGAELTELAALRESNRFFDAELKALKEGRLRTAARHRKELEDLNQELTTVKHSERQLKIKVKQLESDLSAQQTRASTSSVRSRQRSSSPMQPPVPTLRSRSPVRPTATPPSRPYSRTPSPSRYREQQAKSRYEPASPQRGSPVRSRVPSRPSTAAERSMLSDVVTRSPEMRTRTRATIAEPPTLPTAVDIKDIDARLHALQNFLRQTKLSGGPISGL